jgi:hypothetical protein
MQKPLIMRKGEKNTYEIESLQHGTAYNKLMNVQTWK